MPVLFHLREFAFIFVDDIQELSSRIILYGRQVNSASPSDTEQSHIDHRIVTFIRLECQIVQVTAEISKKFIDAC